MSAIRPLERGDLHAVALLHAEEQRETSAEHAGRLERFFERTLLDAPSADEEIPSLVALDGDEIVGFLGSNVRSMQFEGEPIRMACSAHLLTHPQVRQRGVGAILLRTYLAGPQDLTITDGATREVQRMWETLGGATAHLQSLVWIEPLRPATLAVQRLAQRFRARGLEPGLRPLTAAVDVVAGKLTGGGDGPVPEIAAATPESFAAALQELGDAFKLRPAYDTAYLAWLFGELDRSAAAPPVFPDRVRRGPVHAALVSSGGRLIGAFVVQLPQPGACRVLTIAASERHAGTVLGAVRTTAEAHRSSAVFGRVEPHLLAGLWARKLYVRFGGGRMLVHSRRRELLDAPRTGDALLTRLDGEWW